MPHQLPVHRGVQGSFGGETLEDAHHADARHETGAVRVRRVRQHVQEQGVGHEPPADAYGQEDGALLAVRLRVLHQAAAGRAPDQARQAVRVRHMPQAVRAKVAAGRARERGALQPAAVLMRAVQEDVQDEGLARRAHGRAHRHA